MSQRSGTERSRDVWDECVVSLLLISVIYPDYLLTYRCINTNTQIEKDGQRGKAGIQTALALKCKQLFATNDWFLVFTNNTMIKSMASTYPWSPVVLLES